MALPGRGVGVGSDSPHLKEEFGPGEAGDADHRPGREWCLDEALLDLKEASQVGLHAGTAVVVVGFVILGAALAGVFPALIATTPQRIGDERARHAIAWQVGAAAAGGSGISALIGLLIDTTSLAIVGPAILTLALLLVLANTALARLAPIPVPDAPRH